VRTAERIKVDSRNSKEKKGVKGSLKNFSDVSQRKGGRTRGVVRKPGKRLTQVDVGDLQACRRGR